MNICVVEQTLVFFATIFRLHWGVLPRNVKIIKGSGYLVCMVHVLFIVVSNVVLSVHNYLCDESGYTIHIKRGVMGCWHCNNPLIIHVLPCMKWTRPLLCRSSLW